MLVLYLNFLLILGLTAHAQIQLPRCIRILGVDTCRPGYRCENGRCRRTDTSIRCSEVLPCPNLFDTCRNGQCVPAQSGCVHGRDCESRGSFCELNQCVRRPGESCDLLSDPCSSRHECRGGICSLTSGSICGRDCLLDPGNICESGRCRRRLGESCGPWTLPCLSDNVCRRGICSRQLESICDLLQCEHIRGSFCEDNKCVRRPGQSCRRFEHPCSSRYECRGGICVRRRGDQCEFCKFTPGNICENNQCVREPGAQCGMPYLELCSSGYRCTQGTCSPTRRRCRRNRQCGQNEWCRRGYCERRSRQCIYSSECRRNEACRRGVCQPDITTDECGLPGRYCRRGYRCENYQCIPNDITFPYPVTSHNHGRRCGDRHKCGFAESCILGRCESVLS